MTRRRFMGILGLSAAGSLFPSSRATAGTLVPGEFETLVPVDKHLDPSWVASLTARGGPTIYRGAELEKIGMPVGGQCAGQLYLGGDGRLWLWDIFNDLYPTAGSHYAKAPAPNYAVGQGFAVRVLSGAPAKTWTLDAKGFPDVSFSGQYPIGTVNYRDPAAPMSVKLEAFSPFCPLAVDDSDFPATMLRCTLTNTSTARIELELAGWLENATACRSEKFFAGTRTNSRVQDPAALLLACGLDPDAAKQAKAIRAPSTFAVFGDAAPQGWTLATGAEAVPSPAAKPGPAVVPAAQKWTSPPFQVDRRFINAFGTQAVLRPGGYPGSAITLVVDGHSVRAAKGTTSDPATLNTWDVSDLQGKTATIEVLQGDSATDKFAGVARFEFADTYPLVGDTLAEQPDYGTMVLGLLEPGEQDRVNPALDGDPATAAFAPDTRNGQATGALGDATGNKLVGSLVRRLGLAPGESKTATFILAWHFPNLFLSLAFHAGGERNQRPVLRGRYYGTKFDSAAAVARSVATNADRLVSQTELWRETWYDSTLPFWFLDRTLINIGTLASSTAYRLADGRFYGWEGVGSCAGTCTHVWSYEQAMGRLFPELDILLRDRVDYKPGVGFNPATGTIGNRAEVGPKPAADGQAGTILRTYRDHLVSADNAFLTRNWPSIKKAVAWLFTLDSNGDGILDLGQANTLDATWYGQVPWITGLALAAIRAGEKMAAAMGDENFAQQCRAFADLGQANFTKSMWNGEYFEQIPDPTKLTEVGSYNGCEIDQVLGQSWAFQAGLGRVLPEKETKTALQAIWKYNFAPDVGPFRERFKAGRWFAMPGESGLLMCSWPHGDQQRVTKGIDSYFNECMAGFEHQVAGHMIWEGMVQEGLAVERAIHDRYAAAKRNPWCEIECGDHYARSMASYGVFLAACGFEYDGPAGHLGFAPRLNADDFKAAFTAAEGWGSYAQKRQDGKMAMTLALKWGRLNLHSLAFAPGSAPADVAVTLNTNSVPSTHSFLDGRLIVTLNQPVVLKPNDSLNVALT